jgi:hypothetical protein
MIRLSEGWGREASAPPPRGTSDLTFAIIAGSIAIVAATALALFWPF